MERQRHIQALRISQYLWPRAYGSHRGHASPTPYTHSNAAKSFHSIPATAFFQGPLEQQLLRDTKARRYCCYWYYSAVWQGEKGAGTTQLLVPGAWWVCGARLFGPYEVMENFPEHQVLLPSVSCSSYTLGKCYKHTGTI